MLACSVETTPRQVALMWWLRASKPTGFSEWVSLSQSLSISRLISPHRPRRQGVRPRRRYRHPRRSGSSSTASGHLNCPPPRGRRCCRRRSKVAPVRETAASSLRLPLFRVIGAAMIFVAEVIGGLTEASSPAETRRFAGSSGPSSRSQLELLHLPRLVLRRPHRTQLPPQGGDERRG
jgi:hypothetical protein